MISWFPHALPWRLTRTRDVEHALDVEDTLAVLRVALILVSLAVAWFEHWRPIWNLVVVVLACFGVYSLALLWAVRARRIRSSRAIALVHVVDTVTILLVLVLAGGALSPFSTLFLFVMLAAGFRWGQVETWITTGAGMLVLGAHGMARSGQLGPPLDLHIIGLRLAYMALGGILLGFIAETERIHRHRTRAVSRILERVRSEGGLVAAVQAVLQDLLAEFRATHAVLLLEEEGSDIVSLWQAEAGADPSKRPLVRLNQLRRDAADSYLFPVPANADAWEVRRPAPDRPADSPRVAVMNVQGRWVAEPIEVSALFSTPFDWRAALCLSSVAGHGWKGRVFLFLPRAPRWTREYLRYLQAVVRLVGPALFNLYLQRRLQSRAGVVERARISRELHDGVIQTLIGIQMQLEVLRREIAGQLSETSVAQLAGVQRVLAEEILDIRDLMHLLKPAEVDAMRLVEHLADTVERFRHRTGIQARLACDVDEIDLAPRVCRELAGIVHEALANVRKHSGATSVLVRLARCNGAWQLAIDDNGCGLDFDGYLTHEELDQQRKGPAIIKERVQALGGRLGIHSQPGFGTRLEITIPGKHHA